MNQVYLWVGIVTVYGVAALLCLGALAVAYATLIHRRFSWIPFRKGQRRLSIASWYNSHMHGSDWGADDWLINERPFLVQYRIGKRRLFLMAGLMDEPRFGKVHGKHPTQGEPG